MAMRMWDPQPQGARMALPMGVAHPMCVAPASGVINYAGGNASAVAPTSEIPVRPMAMGWPQPGQPQSYQLGIQWSTLSGPILNDAYYTCTETYFGVVAGLSLTFLTAHSGDSETAALRSLESL